MNIDLKNLAEFVDEGLAGLGVLDDADEIFFEYASDGDIKDAREALERYNNAIRFVNEQLGRDYDLISEEDFQEWTSTD